MDDSIYQNIFLAIEEPILMLSSSGNIVDANPCFESLVGHERGYLRGKEISLIINTGVPALLKEVKKWATAGSSFSPVVSLKRADGSICAFDFRVFQIEKVGEHEMFGFHAFEERGELAWLDDVFDLTTRSDEEIVPVSEDILPTHSVTSPPPTQAMVPAPIPRDFILPDIIRADLTAHTITQEMSKLVREGIVILDIEGKITGLNPPMEDMVGKMSGDLQGSNMSHLFSSVEGDRASQLFATIIEKGDVVDEDISLKVSGASCIGVKMDGVLIEDPGGMKVGVMLVIKVEKEH